MPPRSKSQLKLQKSPCTVLKNKDKGLISTQSAKINVGKGCKRTHGEFTAKTHVQVLGGVERRRELGRPIAVLVPTELHVDHLLQKEEGQRRRRREKKKKKKTGEKCAKQTQ
mmetsp:Transcript_21469/g.36219  ORF Transcript_21469/g.36219 Transcript_21469/m.36219 type:complete len:112 (+) Transcript_21469:221-556(+)